jgi:hypothetical protein
MTSTAILVTALDGMRLINSRSFDDGRTHPAVAGIAGSDQDRVALPQRATAPASVEKRVPSS